MTILRINFEWIASLEWTPVLDWWFQFFLNTNYILEHSLNLMLFNLEQIWWDKPSQKLIPSTPFISRYKIRLQIPTVLDHSSYVPFLTYRTYGRLKMVHVTCQYKGFVLV